MLAKYKRAVMRERDIFIDCFTYHECNISKMRCDRRKKYDEAGFYGAFSTYRNRKKNMCRNEVMIE